MARSKPPLVRLSELVPGQFADCFALLAERTKGATRDGKPFYTCRFRDNQRTMSVMVWSDSANYMECDQHWREGQFYKIRGTYGEHERYGPQFDLQVLREVIDADRAEGFDSGDFGLRTRFDVEAMFAELVGLAEANIADSPLRRLVLPLLDGYREPFQQLPATQRNFYPFPGGLLEHTLSVTKSCLDLAAKYAATYSDLLPPLNRDLIVAAAILHDIGRVVELESDGLTTQPTVPGRLFGHLFLGRDLVRDAARELGDVDPELLRLLEHLIITHLNLPEWGSPKLPLVPECLILHHADDLDAKMEMYARCLRNDRSPGPFTARDPVLGRNLYKGRKV